jgi:hypothetical protein
MKGSVYDSLLPGHFLMACGFFGSFLGIVNVGCMIGGVSKRNIVALPAFTLTLVIRSVISWCDVDGLGFDVCFDV